MALCGGLIDHGERGRQVQVVVEMRSDFVDGRRPVARGAPSVEPLRGIAHQLVAPVPGAAVVVRAQSQADGHRVVL